MPYVLDNGAFPAWTKGEPWDEEAWLSLVEWGRNARSGLPSRAQKPQWMLIPDVVADPDATLEAWDRWAPKFWDSPIDLAFAAQDGMTCADIPNGADVVFIGGTKQWKWSVIDEMCEAFPRVHVGRVNTYSLLRRAQDAGAESCDGTGWFRGDKNQLRGLQSWLQEEAGEIPRETQLTLGAGDL